MRVLVVAAPLVGHVFPLVPLARALHGAGHEIVFVTAGDGLRVAAAGFPVRDAAPGFTFHRAAVRAVLRRPFLIGAEPAGTAGTRMTGGLFGAVNDAMLAGVLDAAREWRPDRILFEPSAAAGAVVAARLGVTGILHENSLYDGPALLAATRMRGRPELAPPAAVIRIAPASVAGRGTHLPMRFVPWAGAGELPGWLAEPSHRPRILVSRSTVARPGPDRTTPRIVAAAAEVDADVVLIRPPEKYLTVRPAAEYRNVRSVGWVPIPAALASATAIIHHGGAGTTLTALQAGVPQLIVRGAGDRRHNAELVAARGAGLAADPRDISPALLNRLLTDPVVGSVARAVRAEIAAMPPPENLVEAIRQAVR
ncbi:nucleotide disphospho-sugar-binding domain-containing protein [Actinoplanes couchii]|uniref:Glucosyl transferase n=1 Tax=Actinoplanes couchii TaxID=403638 RepID=A0ABQ3XPG8_9ACTN|nr:nucleotide disphospho-sugar-binding domain-containing protein [Actinoplanes couchii]MDR6315824.1 UDP:flavonoid glycosyltransferase YjiC (YdhE family) [Actinoplanes couchii]GID60380.1 glucosyl transferase [Actinoplanes couchii]